MDPASLHILITVFSPRLGFDTGGFVKLEDIQYNLSLSYSY